ncbi:MAG: aldo/keto reductase [Rhodobacteraceae bacterium]|nr:aldo/keto reductase [Paracoccaceae bacterium]
MKMNRLGGTDIHVSGLCLGTMTYGTQTSEADAHRQIDMAIDHGINFVDTAEMYPVTPISADTQGDSERIIGSWVRKSGRRDKILIATKVSGQGLKIVRDGAPISGQTIRTAIETSLRSLQTDIIDLYQLHWPNRGSYWFRQHWTYDPTSQNRAATLDHMEEALQTMQRLADEGKVKLFGLSNESAWGTAQFLRIAEQENLPKVETIQNEYSLLCRLFDTDLAELAYNEQVGLLAYSPLATGLLTGKYLNGHVPEGSRMTISPGLGGRVTKRVHPAVTAYQEVADKHGLPLPLMSLAWCLTRPFVTSAIFGATTSDKVIFLRNSALIELSEDCLNDINDAYRSHPLPY